MEWETLYCPHRHCRGYEKPLAQGYLVKNDTSRGQPRTWRPVTLAMAAGLTDHVWTTGKLLAYRVPVGSLTNCMQSNTIFQNKCSSSRQLRDTTKEREVRRQDRQ